MPDATAGKCIAVVKYNVDATATALYSGILEGNGMDTTEYPDETIHEYLKFYWDEVSLSQPYSFFVTNWEQEQTVYAYALDANGGQGALGRGLLLPTAEAKGKIEDLKALVSELSSATKAMSTSVSVDDIKIEAKKPVVTGKKTSNNEVTMTAPSPKMMSQIKPSIKRGGLMQIDFVPAFWTK